MMWVTPTKCSAEEQTKNSGSVSKFYRHLAFEPCTLVGDYGRRDQIFDAIPPAVCARTGALPRNGTYPPKSERLRRPAVVKRCALPSHHTNPVNNGYHCPKRVSWLASMGADKATDGDGAVPTLNRLINKHTLSENLGIDSLKTTTTENITAYAQKATARRRQIRHHDDLGITGVHTRECAHLLSHGNGSMRTRTIDGTPPYCSYLPFLQHHTDGSATCCNR